MPNQNDKNGFFCPHCGAESKIRLAIYHSEKREPEVENVRFSGSIKTD